MSIDEFRDRRPDVIIDTKHVNSRTLIACASVSLFTLVDFWLSCQAWFFGLAHDENFSGDPDNRNEFEPPVYSPEELERTLTIQFVLVDSPTYSTFYKNFLRLMPGVQIDKCYDVVNWPYGDGYIMLIESAGWFYLYSWATSE